MQRPPFPMIVGVGRSGTTLLRMMIDAHPDIVIPPETHWLMGLIKELRRADYSPERARSFLLEQSTWHDLDISDGDLRAILAAHDQTQLSETLRSIYRCYADRHRSPRVGDKTPAHGLSMVEIAEAIPEAHFIHIIRDGRDVAVSYRGLRFGPGEDAHEAAVFWKTRVEKIRSFGQRVERYMELRYEALLDNPEAELRKIADFIHLPFDRRQLDAHEFAAERLSELKTVAKNGRVLTSEQRQDVHRLTVRKPDRTRVGRWKDAMDQSQVDAFHRAAGDLLEQLGYR